MGSRSRHTAQEGDAFCLLEMNVLVQKVKINPRTAAKDLVKMLEEIGPKIFISTVKRVLYQHKLRKKMPDYGLHLHMGTKIILFGEMSSGLMKQK